MTESGNSARFRAVPLSCSGTPHSVWQSADPLPLLDLSGCQCLIAVSAHPDDETLGLGATIAQLAARGVDVQLVSVSDGGAEHRYASKRDRLRRESIRRDELHRAAHILGIGTPLSLGLPDGRLDVYEQQIVDGLGPIVADAPSGTWCAATWRGDGHPDHEAVGRAAAAACALVDIPLLEYPIWMWHWATPGDPDVPWECAYSAPAPQWAVRRKQAAAQCFRSQIEQSQPHTPPVVPRFALHRFFAVKELVFR